MATLIFTDLTPVEFEAMCAKKTKRAQPYQWRKIEGINAYWFDGTFKGRPITYDGKDRLDPSKVTGEHSTEMLLAWVFAHSPKAIAQAYNRPYPTCARWKKFWKDDQLSEDLVFQILGAMFTPNTECTTKWIKQ